MFLIADNGSCHRGRRAADRLRTRWPNIAPFSQKGYENYTLGDASQQTLREIWNGPAYRDFRAGLLSDHPPAACASCGLRWSL